MFKRNRYSRTDLDLVTVKDNCFRKKRGTQHNGRIRIIALQQLHFIFIFRRKQNQSHILDQSEFFEMFGLFKYKDFSGDGRLDLPYIIVQVAYHGKLVNRCLNCLPTPICRSTCIATCIPHPPGDVPQA